MKIQSVTNYQSDRNNQPSFGIVKLDKRGFEHLPEGARKIIAEAYDSVQSTLGPLINYEKIDVLVHPIQEKDAPAGVIITQFLLDGRKIEKFCSSNNPLFEWAVAKHIFEAITTKTFGYGTFVDCAKANPKLSPSLWDTTLPLSKTELQERFTTLA